MGYKWMFGKFLQHRWLTIWFLRTSGEYDGWMPCLGLRCWRLLRTLSLCCPQRSELTTWKICKVSVMILTGVNCPKMWVSHWQMIYFKAMPDVLKQLLCQLLWLLVCLAYVWSSWGPMNMRADAPTFMPYVGEVQQCKGATYLWPHFYFWKCRLRGAIFFKGRGHFFKGRGFKALFLRWMMVNGLLADDLFEGSGLDDLLEAFKAWFMQVFR